MANSIKDQEAILAKLNIYELNPMQLEAVEAIKESNNIILLSPTGTGKTLAFSLPLINSLDPVSKEIQALILVPSRELAIQIEQVIRSMGSGFKINAVYGGRPMAKDKIELKHLPAILIGTPSSSILIPGSGVITLRAEKSTRLPIRLPRIRPSFDPRRCWIDLRGRPLRWALGATPGIWLSTSVAM